MKPTPSNRLLDSLTPRACQQVLSLCRRVDLPVGTMLYEADARPANAFFLVAGFASQVVTTPGSGTAEVGLIAREGVVGDWALLGNAKSPGQCFMQAAGAGYTLPFEHLQALFQSSVEIRARLLEYAQEQAMASIYLAACNKLHETELRLARWLLMVGDRLETDVLHVKHEFLAQMLGTRRMTVTTTAGALQRGGLIEYRRGQVRILDRDGLEAAACECYGHLKTLYSGLYSGPVA